MRQTYLRLITGPVQHKQRPLGKINFLAFHVFLKSFFFLLLLHFLVAK